MEKMLLTVDEAAEALSLGRTKVFGMIRRGELESIKVGDKARRVPVDALKTYIERERAAQAN